MEELEKITVADMETISNAVLQMIKSYPELPTTLKKTVLWQYLDKAESLGIYTMTGAVYLKKIYIWIVHCSIPIPDYL